MAQRASVPLRLLPLVAAVEAHERSGFSGILRLLMPGEEARIFIRDGQARLCAGAAAHYSLGAWLLRSEALRAGELKALNERAQASGTRLEDVLLADGRFSPEKLRAAQNAMSHFTFADVAVRPDLTIEARPGDPPQVVNSFQLDAGRAVAEYTSRWESEPPLVSGSFTRGPAFEERRTTLERVFTGVGEALTQRLEQGPLSAPPHPAESGQRGGAVIGAASPFHRALLAAVRMGVAALIPERVEVRRVEPAPGMPALQQDDTRDEPWVLVGPRVPAQELTALEARLMAEGLLKPRSAGFALRQPAAATQPATSVVAMRSQRAPTGPPPPLAELPPLQDYDDVSTSPDLHAVLEQAVRAAADSESEVDAELFAVHIDDPDDEPVTDASATMVASFELAGAVGPAARPLASGARATPLGGAGAGSHAASVATSATRTRPGAPLEPTGRLSGPIESRPSGVVVRSSGATARAPEGRQSIAPLLPPARRPPSSSPHRELLEFRAFLGGAGPLEALGLPVGAVLSSVRSAWVSRRAQYDPARATSAPPEVVKAAHEVADALDAALADLTHRERRTAIEAAAGGISALEVSSCFGADALYREGRRAFANNDFRAAYSAFQRAMQRYPREPDHATWAAQALWELSRADSAGGLSDVALSSIERHLEEALAAAPSYEPALMQYARLELERGRPSDALARYRTVLDANPHQLEASAAAKELSAYAKQAPRSSGVFGSLAARLVPGLNRDKGSTEG